MSWSTACPDWDDRLVAGRSLIPDLPLFKSQADKALRIFRRLRVPDMVGTPTYGEVCGDWVFDFVRALFGAYNPKTRRRMIREFFLLIPKKNGKSSIAAAIMVTAAIMNARPEAELLLIAPTKKIADIAFKQAAGIIRLDTELAKIFHPQNHQRTITHEITGAQILIKAADADVITGSKATFILIDETHVFSLKSKAADIFVEIRGSLAARPDGFLLQITTQSKDPPAGVFKSELAIARDVRDGEIQLPILPVLYELPAKIAANDGWKDPATWGLVNPNLNRSVDEAFLRDEVLKAEREGVSQLALIASQHFNVEVGMALRNDRWPGAEFWSRRAVAGLTLEILLKRSEVIVVGIDGGGLDDLFGMSIVGRCKETRDWLVWSHAWCHEGVLERRKSIAQQLLDFKRDGDLTIVDDELDDISGIVAIVDDINKRGLLASVAVDPAGLGQLIEALDEIGVTQEGGQLIGAPQGWQLMNAIKTAERKLANGTLLHAGSAMMAWCVGNLRIEPTATGIRATKQSAGDAKIDPVMALFDAVTVMSRNPAVIRPADMDSIIKNAVFV